MKSVLIAIQPYWVFLIIAKTMGWEIDQEKTVEVRKNFPKDLDWNKKSIIYCSKNKQSFNRIPKKYQPLMERFLGKAIGYFICDRINFIGWASNPTRLDWKNAYNKESCLTNNELYAYTKGGLFYEWHISNLVIYDKPKELSEFYAEGECDTKNCEKCIWFSYDRFQGEESCELSNRYKPITRPPQSWCYVEELGVQE